MAQKNMKFEKNVTMTLDLDYLLYLPEGYSADKKYPLVLFLHGAGERGNNLEKVKIWGPPKLVQNGKKFPFILVSPQCPKNVWWDSKMLDLYALLKQIKQEYSVDHNRVYLTGLSMGGYGSWEMAISYPEEFAAVIPLCGGVLRKRMLNKIKDIPIWTFHGEKDMSVLLSETTDAVKILKDMGSDIKVTIYSDLEHQIQSRTYDNPEVYKWMLAQNRKNR